MLLQYGNDSFIWVVFIFILLYLCISTYCNKKQENGDEKGEIVPTWGLFLPASLLENNGVENGVKIKKIEGMEKANSSPLHFHPSVKLMF